VEQLVKELKHEKDGVYRVSQKSRRVTAARAYVYFKLDPKKELVILDITGKPNKKEQNKDIQRAVKRKKDDE
jgi:hypothetical protein